MGAVWSRSSTEAEQTDSVTSEENTSKVSAPDCDNDAKRKRRLQEEMGKFKADMAQKREARHEAIKALNSRIFALEKEKETAVNENVQLREELDKMRSESEVNALQTKLVVDEDENESEDDETTKDEIIEGLNHQVRALKDVAKIGTEMLRIRELQVNELKSKLVSIEETGAEYEKEVENMKKLRNLYEERARAMTISHQMEMEREKSKLLAAEMRQKIAEHRVAELEEKSKELEEKLSKVDGLLDDAKKQISDLKIKLAGKNEDLYNATSQMAVVNHLFSQLLSPGQDSIEKITKVLQENHDLVNHLTVNGTINELASTLVEIADKDPLPASEEQDNDMSGHLSKVWRLLVELLGHHMNKPAAPEEETPESCYKSVDTPSGPKVVISVSQTFLRLKDLILEKNSLMKEVGRLKDLNSTLESRLLVQESRLSVVAGELCSTWSVVNKLKKQHANLHTSEKVLRYELAQKRLLLTELKKKLEECKENWSLAKLKNSQTEKDWKLLRAEFASRKQQASSAESGYEESPTDSQDEEDNWKDDKNDKSSVTSDEEDHCAVLAWNDPEEVRTERRGTLTNDNSENQECQDIPSFAIDHQVDACILLPWTESASSNQSEATYSTQNSATDFSVGEACGRISEDSVELPNVLGGRSSVPPVSLSSPQLLPEDPGPESLSEDNKSCHALPRFETFQESSIPQNLVTVDRCSAGESANVIFEASGDELAGETQMVSGVLGASPEIDDQTSHDDAAPPDLPGTSCSRSYVDFTAQKVLPKNHNGIIPVGEPSANQMPSANARHDDDSGLTAPETSCSQSIGENSSCNGKPDVPSNSTECFAVGVQILDVPAPSSNSLADVSQANQPTTSNSPQTRERTAEEILQARQDRLRRLEEGCQGLFNRMSRTNQRSEIINSRLTELHEIYGEERPSRRRLEEESAESSSNSTEESSVVGNSATIIEPPTPPPFPEFPLFLPRTGGPEASSSNQ